LATDSSRVVDSVLDVAKSRQLEASTLIMVLQPTSPFRTEHHIRDAAGLLHGQDSSAVVSVVECEHHPLKTVRIENQRIVPTNEHRFLEASRQDLPRIFRPNGALYLAPLTVTIQTGSLVPPHAHSLEMSREDSLDIDSANDLMLAQLLLQRRG
jgi:CMP-N-acetylneuraminic acid synthetase